MHEKNRTALLSCFSCETMGSIREDKSDDGVRTGEKTSCNGSRGCHADGGMRIVEEQSVYKGLEQRAEASEPLDADKGYHLIDEIKKLKPYNAQERNDQKEMLRYLKENDDFLTRKNKNAHVTVSAWIVDKSRQYVLMAFHNIYHSWAWLGGHADGNEDLREVILKEIEEESGLKDIFSLEILPAFGHEKKGEYVSSHLHLNVTYAVEADLDSTIRIKEDENCKIGWIRVDEIGKKSTEQWFVERIYAKLCEKVKAL